MFIHFNDIQVKEKITWNNNAILSFDIDWASDEVINYAIDSVEKYDVKCCFFVTHKTEVLQRIRENPNFELGLHPNFNPLLNNSSNKSAEEIITDLKSIVPEANVLRSHSLTTSGSWLGLYKNIGIKYLSNYMMNGVDSIQPFYHINGLVEVPIYFADDGDIFLKENLTISKFNTQIDLNISHQGIKVFNFHPIHIALNTVKYSQYELAKPFQKDFQKLLSYRKDEVGCETHLREILNYKK